VLFRDELAASLAGKKVFSQALREAKVSALPLAVM
jgi:hypothetical protein